MNKIYKTILGVSAAAIVAGASLIPASVNAWGDNLGGNGRNTYTLAQINRGDLGNTITFNSITNGKIGDERNFVGARKGTTISGGTWSADTLKVSDGDVITVRLYVHNNNPNGTNAVATGVSTSFSIPTAVGKSQTIIGYLNAANAAPTRYWDEVTLTSDDNFYLEYVDGSAKYTNTQGTFSLSDSILTSGATIGYTSMNGQIPGCYTYDGQATIQLKVHKSVASKVSKTVRIKGSGAKFAEVVDAKVGDEVEYQIEYQNLLSETVTDVMIRDVLPNNMQYVADSTYLYNSHYPSGVKMDSNNLTTTGVNIGAYKTDAFAVIRFTAKVVDKSLACGDNQLVNWASSTVKGIVSKDDASVMVKKSGDVCNKVTPNPTPNKDENKTTPSGTPKTIANTGPETIVTGAVGAGGVVTTLGYFIASRKKF